MTVLIVAGWLACSALAFWLLVRISLNEFGVATVGDAILHGGVSLFGPFSLLGAIIILAIFASEDCRVCKKPLWTKRP